MADSMNMTAMNVTATLTTAANEPSTFSWENEEAKEARRTLYYIFHGIVGLMAIVFNGVVLVAAKTRKNVRHHISLVMMNMFVFCFIHGWIVGIIYPLQRVYRMVMLPELCVLTTLLMDFADNYILILLPVLAIERLILIRHPHANEKKVKVWSIVSMILVVVVTMLSTWLPLIPGLDVPTTVFVTSDNSQRRAGLEKFYTAYSCNYLINKKNYLEPKFTISIEIICVIVVVGVNLAILYMLKQRLSMYSSLSDERKQHLKKACINVLIVAIVFIFTFLPYGIVHQYRNYNCEANTSDKTSSWCNNITIELRFVFSILAHLGNFLAPLMFIVLSTNLRKALVLFLRCKDDVHVQTDVEFVSTLTESRININIRNDRQGVSSITA